jgi:hypothetical protein
VNSILNNPSDVETRVCRTLASLRERYKQLEDRLQQLQGPASCDLATSPIKSSDVGPATAALEIEQKSLRQAAVARYDMKRREKVAQRKQQSIVTTPTNSPNCASVSLASFPSSGGFASSDVIALSMLGGNLGREKIANQALSAHREIKDEASLEVVRERLQLIEHQRPAKLRKIV